MAAKLLATVNSSTEGLELERRTPGAPWALNGAVAPDLVQTGPGLFSLVHKGRSFKVLVLKRDKEAGTVRLRIGAHCHTVRLADERTRLMQLLGIDRGARAMASELKAPMPGLVLKVLVKEGDVVKKDDPLLVLEAMKMENVIKSTGEGVVKKAHAQAGAAVEKGQLLLSFEK
ncbi:MAG: biotin/lipoyl-binding protein [Flavobacteriales bacterium]|nr:biotin/lipoyl-binding protein [Flavobacteriales bacterium]MBP9079535.1 biotin/lipoyl-binding protein [Flavobacteriales bacterium]